MRVKAYFLLLLLAATIFAQSITVKRPTKCNLSGSCSKAKPFSNAQEFNNFMNTYYPPPPPTPQASTISTRSANIRLDDSQTRPATKPVAKDSLTTRNEANVDEADIMKTYGNYIYTISNQSISIVSAVPVDQATKVSTITFTGTDKPLGLFVYGETLVIFGIITLPNSPSNSGESFICIYDVTNRANPTLVKRYTVSGTYFDGRMVETSSTATKNGFMYLVFLQDLDYFRKQPYYIIDGSKTNFPFESISFYPDQQYTKPIYINVIGFDLKNRQSSIFGRSFTAETGNFNPHTWFVTAAGKGQYNILYMSENGLYFGRNLRKNNLDYTRLSKIYINELLIIPIAETEIRGTTNNQFSLSESGPYLRIATTNYFPTKSSNVYVLSQYLTSYGLLENIAPTEEIYSCRYIFDKLYLVTFKHVDPLFAISLADPANPTIIGELANIPGASYYLYPIDEDSLVGLGRNYLIDNQGRPVWSQGGPVITGDLVIYNKMKIDIYNIRNSTPALVISKQYSNRAISSLALVEHKAVLFIPSRKLMVIPITDPTNNFHGADIWKVSATELDLVGSVEHGTSIERSASLGNNLYTKSLCKIIVTDIISFVDLKEIPISC